MTRSRAGRRRWGQAYEWLAAHLEPAHLAEFVEHYGGSLMRVPSRVRESRAARTDRVLAELADRATYHEAADAVGVSVTTAYRDANRVSR